MSSEEEICKTRAEQNHHDWTTRHRASSPQIQPQPQLRLHSRGRPTPRPSDTSEQEPTTTVIAATKPSLISIVVAAQATTRNLASPASRPQCLVRPAHQVTWKRARSSRRRRHPKEGKRRQHDARRPTQGLGFHLKSFPRDGQSRRRLCSGAIKKKTMPIGAATAGRPRPGWAFARSFWTTTSRKPAGASPCHR
jgi:hypothetical protein